MTNRNLKRFNLITMSMLESRILKKIFFLETTNIIINILFKVFIIGSIGFIIWLLAAVIVEIYQEQGTLDLLQIFQENSFVIRKYLPDTIIVFFDETPKTLILILLISLLLFLITIYFIIKNSRRFKNKIKAIIKFWNKNKN